MTNDTSPAVPTHEQLTAGYDVACKFGVYENRAFDLAEQIWMAMSAAQLAGSEALRDVLAAAKGAIEMLVHNIDPDLGHSDNHKWEALDEGNKVLAAIEAIDQAKRSGHHG